MTSVYARGQSVIVSATFTNAASAPANPLTVTLQVKSPSGVITTPTPANVGTGVYEATIIANESGYWRYHWAGTTGSVTPNGEQVFFVSASGF
jgi:hypothetical protein